MLITSDSLEYISGVLRFTERQIKINTGHDVKLTMSNVKELNHFYNDPNEMMMCILNALCVSLHSVRGSSRKKPIVTARHIIAFFLRKHFKKMSLDDIANMLGGLDHSTVINAINKCNRMIEAKDEEFMQGMVAAQKAVDSYLKSVAIKNGQDHE